MGKFANSAAEMEASQRLACEAEGIEYIPADSLVGAYIGPRPRDMNAAGMFHGKSEWDALGLPVPFFRRSAGIKHLRQMGFTDRELMDRIVGKMASHIERDDSHMALEDALKMGLDVTGCYRLLSVLLCEPAPQPETQPESVEATFLDLVGAQA